MLPESIHDQSGTALPATLLTHDIDGLDLSLIKIKLQDSDEGPGWSAAACDAVEIEYKQFLALKRAYPEREIVPNRPVDKFWHQHILDTEKYATDCEAVFGYFVHHFPYFGMRGADDKAALEAAFADTNALFERHFGVAYAAASGRCRTACKPVKCK